MPNDQFFNSFFALITNPAEVQNAFWVGFKILVLLAFLLYIFFAVIVVRQVHLMSKTFVTSAEPLLKLLAYTHLLFALGILFFAYVIL